MSIQAQKYGSIFKNGFLFLYNHFFLDGKTFLSDILNLNNNSTETKK